MIPLVDLRRQYAALKQDIAAAIEPVMAEARFIGGAEVASFETEFAAWCGAGHAVGVASGTDALLVALWALGLRVGDEVILPAHTFIATGEAVRMLGAVPVFADVTADSFTIDPADVARRLTAKTRAIVPVHLYGRPADMDALAALSRDHGVALVGDGAQAHGAAWRDQPLARFGQATRYSFFPGTNLGAFGDAGAIVTEDAELARRMRMIANHGRTGKYEHDIQGMNARLDALQAAVLRVKLRHLSGWCAARRAHAAAYAERLAGVPDVVVPALAGTFTHGMHLFVIRVPAAVRDGLLAHLKGKEIEAGVHYPIPLHLQPCNRDLGGRRGDLPVTEGLADEIVSLPMFPELTPAEIDHVAGAVVDFFRAEGR